MFVSCCGPHVCQREGINYSPQPDVGKAALAPASVSRTDIHCLIDTNSCTFRFSKALDVRAGVGENRTAVYGGVLVSTWETRQRRHAEDGSWASLIIGPNINC